MKIALVQLGCPKNLVDGEWVVGQLIRAGHQLVPLEKADAVLVNTCGFINDAKEESLEKIIEAVDLKRRGLIQKVIVFGCLSERYRDELKKDLPEVDGFFPLSAIGKAAEMLKDGGDKKFTPGEEIPLPENYASRIRLTPPHTAYIKIGEGCGHSCSFCAIPKIRGRSRSRSLPAIMKEIKSASDKGVMEVNLVSQDTTGWSGRTGKESLVDLVGAIGRSKPELWVRILYLYPSKVTKDLLDVWSGSEPVLPYFDIPFQHASKRVLESMKRPGSYQSYIRLIERIRKTFKEPSIRSSFIVGFPTEKSADFKELASFLKDAELDNVGFFEYSREEGTAAFKLKNGAGKKLVGERLAEIAEIQQRISLKKNEAKIGRAFKVLIEGYSEESDLLLEGRAWFQAPDIDGKTYITKGNAAKGGFEDVRITSAHHYDLAGEIISSRKKKNVG